MTTAARLLVCVLMLVTSAVAAEPTTAKAPADDVETKLKATLPECRFQAVPLKDAVDFIRDVTGLSITLDRAAMKAAGVSDKMPITVQRNGPTVQQALDTVAAQMKKGQHVFVAGAVGGRVLVTTEARLDAAHKQYAIDALKGDAKILGRKLPELNFNAIGLTHVVDFLRDITGSNISIDWRAVEAAGVPRNTPVTVRLRDVSFHEALRAVLDSASASAKQPLDFTVDDKNVISIAPVGAAK